MQTLQPRPVSTGDERKDTLFGGFSRGAVYLAADEELVEGKQRESIKETAVHLAAQPLAVVALDRGEVSGRVAEEVGTCGVALLLGNVPRRASLLVL